MTAAATTTAVNVVSMPTPGVFERWSAPATVAISLTALMVSIIVVVLQLQAQRELLKLQALTKAGPEITSLLDAYRIHVSSMCVSLNPALAEAPSVTPATCKQVYDEIRTAKLAAAEKPWLHWVMEVRRYPLLLPGPQKLTSELSQMGSGIEAGFIHAQGALLAASQANTPLSVDDTERVKALSSYSAAYVKILNQMTSLISREVDVRLHNGGRTQRFDMQPDGPISIESAEWQLDEIPEKDPLLTAWIP